MDRPVRQVLFGSHVVMADEAERYWMGLEAERDTLQAENAEQARTIAELREHISHRGDCILSQWRQGRPTSDGGYETQYGDTWYPQGEEPECTCGIDEALKRIKDV